MVRRLVVALVIVGVGAGAFFVGRVQSLTIHDAGLWLPPEA